LRTRGNDRWHLEPKAGGKKTKRKGGGVNREFVGPKKETEAAPGGFIGEMKPHVHQLKLKKNLQKRGRKKPVALKRWLAGSLAKKPFKIGREATKYQTGVGTGPGKVMNKAEKNLTEEKKDIHGVQCWQ